MTDDMDFAPPKYAQIVNALRRRIADGTYPPGSVLPSETQLIKEFGVSRPTVVRALDTLKLRGEIDREHGRGSFVKAVAGTAAGDRDRPVGAVLERAEIEEPGVLVVVERRPAPAAVARLLDVPESSPLVFRQRVVVEDGVPRELVSLWMLPHVAEAAGLDVERPLSAGVRQSVQAATHTRFGRVTERLMARRPTAEEAASLGLDETAPVLGVLAAVSDTAGHRLLVVDLVFPGELHELADDYAL
jgi:GntR family transcriptional regulator